MELFLDLAAFTLPIVFMYALSRYERSARLPERVERGLTHEETKKLTEWDAALMAGRLLNGDRLEAGHRLKLESGGTTVWDGERWLYDSTKEPMKLIASGNKYWRGDCMQY